MKLIFTLTVCKQKCPGIFSQGYSQGLSKFSALNCKLSTCSNHLVDTGIHLNCCLLNSLPLRYFAYSDQFTVISVWINNCYQLNFAWKYFGLDLWFGIGQFSSLSGSKLLCRNLCIYPVHTAALEIVGLQMHSLHQVDTGIDVTIWNLVWFSLRCIWVLWSLHSNFCLNVQELD